jgi:hypothetical protein
MSHIISIVDTLTVFSCSLGGEKLVLGQKKTKAKKHFQIFSRQIDGEN